MISRWGLFGLLTMMCCVVSLGCGNNENDTDLPAEQQEVDDPRCGPNAYYHGGLGVEGHCDCKDGFKRVGEDCVSDDTPVNPVGTRPDPPTPTETQRALSLGCWVPSGSLCDPRDASGCDLDDGHTCDIGKTEAGGRGILCLPGPNTEPADAACDPFEGPFCAHGHHCVEPGVCKRFCCDDSECNDGTSCQPLYPALGTLGVCKEGAPPPANCAGPGGFCQAPSDCCSGNCHVGHCH